MIHFFLGFKSCCTYQSGCRVLDCSQATEIIFVFVASSVYCLESIVCSFLHCLSTESFHSLSLWLTISLFKMSGFTVDTLQNKLHDLNNSQQSIQTLSLWLIHYRKHYQLVVKTWYKTIISSKSTLAKNFRRDLPNAFSRTVMTRRGLPWIESSRFVRTELFMTDKKFNCTRRPLERDQAMVQANQKRQRQIPQFNKKGLHWL